MKVYVFPMDVEACGYYRLIWPARVLKAQGVNVKIIHPNHPSRISGEVNDAGELVSVSAPDDADVMVFQRVASRHLVKAIPTWRKAGIAVVVDIDDDMSAIDPNNPAWNVLHPTTHGADGRLEQYNWQHAQRFAEAATYVTVSTEPLLRKYAHHGRGVVLPNCVPHAVTQIPHVETPNLVGWGGNVSTHPNDPIVVGPALARIQNDGYDFRIIGPSRNARKAFTLNRDPQVTGGVPFAAWFHQIAQLSVGISPLAGTKFNDAKSWLKPLEYAALGVPSVGSPRAEYRKLAAMGIGLLAESPKDWYRHVSRLLREDQLRHEMGEYVRALVIEKLTIETNAWRWLEAWQAALRIQRQGAGDVFRRRSVATAGGDEGGPQMS